MNEKRINAITELTVSETLKKIDEFVPGAVYLKDGPLGNDFESILYWTINDAVKSHFHVGNCLQVGKLYKFINLAYFDENDIDENEFPVGEVLSIKKSETGVKAKIKFLYPYDSMYYYGFDEWKTTTTFYNIQDPDIWKIIPEEEV